MLFWLVLGVQNHSRDFIATLGVNMMKVYHAGNSLSIMGFAVRGAALYVEYFSFELAFFAVAFFEGFVYLTKCVVPN